MTTRFYRRLRATVEVEREGLDITAHGGFLAYLALWVLLPVGTVAGGQVRPAAIELNERNLGLAAKALCVVPATMTSGPSATSAVASAVIRSRVPPVYRNSITRLRPST